MNRFAAFAHRLARDEDGAALIEYGLLVGLIAMGAVVMMTNVGTQVLNIFTKANTNLTAAAAKG